jgi:DNA-binding Xre family transcriptional regulator
MAEKLISNNNLPLNAIFAELAEHWSKRNDNASSRQLAEHLGIRTQSCSQWKTGSDGRRPTWNAILKLCSDLNMQVVIDAEGCQVKRRRTKKSS